MDSALLSQIQKGRKLKKAVTNDRSAPIIAPSKANGPTSGGGMARPPVPGMTQAPPSIPHTASAPAPVSNGPQLGGLFVNGMPTLRKTRGAAVDTGRNMSSPSLPSTPPSAPPIAPPSAPPSAPSVIKSTVHHNTLPRGFKVPPVPGRALPKPSSPTPPAAPPPPVALGVPPKTQASLAPQGRSRSNSSPQRPIPPPPPPRMAPSPPASPNVPRAGLTVPPALPPGRPRASSASAPNAPPMPPPLPGGTQKNNVRPTGGASAPRSPLPPPPMAKPSSAPFSRPTIHFPLTEGGKYTFRPLSELPKPRSFTKSRHVYPSGEFRGNAYPLNYDKIY
ncbi:hypothetical protein G6F61_003203 [Rhizopus arrhizus]|nr:hypothetical protein G6F61_003203 [Rhizopus arrhizus]